MQQFADILRIAVIASWGILLGLAFRVLVAYRHAEKVAPRGGPGLLTRHVIAVAASYLILAGEAVYENVQKIGNPATWYVPVNAIGFGLGIYALVEVLVFQQRRVSLQTGEIAIRPPETYVPPAPPDIVMPEEEP